jgi:glycosyltransferase involved in cell wall biosynthesis
MIAPEPFFEPRGTPFSVFQRLRALSSGPHTIDLVTYHIGEDVELPGLTIHRIPNVPFIKHVKVGPSYAKPPLDLLLFIKSLFLLLRYRYDVIHSHEEAAFFAMFLGLIFRTPHLYDMHSILPRQLENFKKGNWWWLVKTFELMERWVLNTCSAAIAIGDDLEEYVYGINPDLECMTIHNIALHIAERTESDILFDRLGIDLNPIDTQSIIYTGTFEAYQGLDLLISSAELVVKQFPRALFILVGGKPEQIERLRLETKAKKLEETILFVGTVSPTEALGYLDVADILVSPRIDGTSVPLKIYSYLHAGKPIVATNLLAHTQVLDDKVAKLVEPNKEALAEGICACLSDAEYSKWIASNAQNLAQEKYSYDGYLARVNQVYANFLPKAGLSSQIP